MNPWTLRLFIPCLLRQQLLIMMLCAWNLLGCTKTGNRSDTAQAAREVTAALLIEDESPAEQVIVWTTDNTGAYRSVLLSGNENEVARIALTDGIVIALGNDVFQITADEETVSLCDCDKWKESDDADECPSLLQTASATVLTRTNLLDASNDVPEMSTLLLPIPVEESRLHQITDIHQNVEITGNIGPYLFVHYEQRATLCSKGKTNDEANDEGDDEIIEAEGFQLINLATGEAEPLLTDAEQNEINEKEKKEAADSISDTTGFTHITEDDLHLAQIRPIFVYGLGFGIGYEFKAQSRMSADQNNWNDYSKAVTIQGNKIPEKLTPYIIAPTPVRQIHHNDGILVGGWSRVTGNQAAIDAMLNLSASADGEME